MTDITSVLGRAGLLTAEQREHWKMAWLSTVDHKRIGILYLVTALGFFVIGGIEALFMRLQLAVPNNTLLQPDIYNMLFTMHGTTMIFLVAMPALFGLANYIVPLQIGAHDMAFPRLNAFAFWLVPFGGMLLHFSIVTGGAPAVGWFAYAPLSETPYSSQLGVDYWALALLVLGIGSVATSINLLVTVLTQRAPQMTLRRLPLFSWMIFVNSFLVLLALPVLNAALVLLLIDRRLDTHVFLPSGGGSAIVWQHIFWAFGHPEVYIVAIPAFGILSEIVPVFSRKPIFGYEFVAGSTVAIAFLSLLVWAHHMFTVGLGDAVDLFFVASSLLIAIPTGVKVLAWSATMVGGRIRVTTPMLFCIAALVQFLLAGLTGISHAMAALDWQTKNSYYLVAHFHFVFVGLIVFAILGAVHYWFPKMSGRLLSERLGAWTFWLMTIGFNMTFLVQHVLGLAGMPRRVYTYPDLPGWGWLNMVSTIGALVMAVAAAFFVWNLVASLLHGGPAGDNPWNAWTLEWAASSPPLPENFRELPPIRSRRPLWDDSHRDRPDPPVGTQFQADTSAPEKKPAGVIAFIVSEAGFFAVLILVYLYYNATPQPGPGAHDLNAVAAGLFSLCLFASSVTIWRAETNLREGRQHAMAGWLAATILLGAVFLVGQGLEYWDLYHRGVRVSSNLFATTFVTLTGFHSLHVCVGLVALLIGLGLALTGDTTQGRSPALKAIGLYWHFVDAVWVVVFAAVLPAASLAMTTIRFILSGWTWNPAVLVASALALTIYLGACRDYRRIGWLAGALGVLLITLLSPLNALADGYLFSAHMAQHILLMLIVPALLWLSLPPSLSLAAGPRVLAHPLAGWLAGVSAMWIWHVPLLCDAAIASPPVHAVQTVSLIALGSLFWRQVLAPRAEEGLSPPGAILYLFSACVACSVLGIIITFSPVSVCPLYSMVPVDRLGMLSTIRADWGFTPDRDQQVGGLLMWVPTCVIYLSAIVAQMARWFAEPSGLAVEGM